VNEKDIKTQIIQQFPFNPTSDQLKVIDTLEKFFLTKKDHPMLIVKGYAGTGKTSIISALVKAFSNLDIEFVLLAPTGRSAKVVMQYAGKIAFTVHKKIYRIEQTYKGETFVLAPNKHKDTFFIVDEASMIAGSSGNNMFGGSNLLDDLIRYVYSGKNCRLIFIGDDAQLPPVGLSQSPALNPEYLTRSFHVLAGLVEMKEVVRQEIDSGILHNATILREQINFFEKSTPFPKFNVASFDDIFSITGVELEEELSDAFAKYGEDEVVVICKSNKRANIFNQQIRFRIKFAEGEINGGDKMMVIKNNYHWLSPKSNAGFIANGDTINILSVRNIEEKFGFQFADVTIQLVDYPNEPSLDVKLLLNTIHIESAGLSNIDFKKLYHDIFENNYSDIENKIERHQKVKNDPYFNALHVKFAYAVTCHKSQGGQWDVVFVDQGYFTEEMYDKEYLRWLYTAITRAKKKLYLVNFSKHFVDKNEDDY
jgi:exodeoxyribonuclease V